MTRVTLECRTCGYTARRALEDTPGCRGTHETTSEPAYCPKGHGELARKDGMISAGQRLRNIEEWIRKLLERRPAR